MDLVETARLVKMIKRRYRTFDDSVDNARDLHRLLEDLPYEVAVTNLDNHIRSSVYEPKPAELRGGWTDGSRLKQHTEKLFREREEQRAASVPMPNDVREKLDRIFGRQRA